MGLRPARTCRTVEKVSWSRFSRRRPRKSFVKAMPHNSVQIFHMGNLTGKFDTKINLVTKGAIQARDNAIESARQAANKFLEKALTPANFRLHLLVFPHNVIRENKMIIGAGADRLQSGMAHPYGRANDRAARMHADQPIFTLWLNSKDLDSAKEAFRRAKCKLPGAYRIVVGAS